MLRTEVTRTGVRAIGTTGASVTVTAADWAQRESSQPFPFPRATDDTVTGVASKLRFPPAFVRATRLDDDGAYAVSTPDRAVSLPHGEYLIRADGPVVVYVHFTGRARLCGSSGTPLLTFTDPTEVTLGLRGQADSPPGTITVPKTPAGIATALSFMPAGHRTATPDLTFPRMRGHPPLVSFGDAADVPDAVRRYRRPSNVELTLPADLSYLFPVAPLAYYLGAAVSVGPAATPRLRTPSRVYELDDNPRFQSTVAKFLRRTFLLDCLVRTAVSDDPPPEEVRHLDELDIDADALFGQNIAERLERYLEVPFERVSSDLPEWHLSMYVEPTFEHARSLPHLLADLPNVFLPEAEPLHSEELLKRSLDDFYRGPAGDVSEVDPVKPMLGPGRSHGWLAEGVPIDVFKAIPRAYENRTRFESRTNEPLSAVVVLNDPGMAEKHDDAAEFYRATSPGQIDVRLERCLSIDELASVFESRTDLVHYIGHCEEAGLRCRNGYLSVSSLSESNAEAFFLNACGSFYQGVELVEKGSVAGAVTFDKVLDGHARRVGSAFVRLLMRGFSIERALDLARRRIIMGKDYTVVGDGTHTIVPTDDLPMIATLKRLDDGRFRLRFDAQSPASPGVTYRLPIAAIDRPNLLGTERAVTLTESRLREMLDEFEMPVIYDGDIHWSADLDTALI